MIQVKTHGKLGGDAIERLDPVALHRQVLHRLSQFLSALLDALLQLLREPTHLIEQARVLHRHCNLVSQGREGRNLNGRELVGFLTVHTYDAYDLAAHSEGRHYRGANSEVHGTRYETGLAADIIDRKRHTAFGHRPSQPLAQRKGKRADLFESKSMGHAGNVPPGISIKEENAATIAPQQPRSHFRDDVQNLVQVELGRNRTADLVEQHQRLRTKLERLNQTGIFDGQPRLSGKNLEYLYGSLVGNATIARLPHCQEALRIPTGSNERYEQQVTGVPTARLAFGAVGFIPGEHSHELVPVVLPLHRDAIALTDTKLLVHQTGQLRPGLPDISQALELNDRNTCSGHPALLGWIPVY